MDIKTSAQETRQVADMRQKVRSHKAQEKRRARKHVFTAHSQVRTAGTVCNFQTKQTAKQCCAVRSDASTVWSRVTCWPNAARRDAVDATGSTTHLSAVEEGIRTEDPQQAGSELVRIKNHSTACSARSTQHRCVGHSIADIHRGRNSSPEARLEEKIRTFHNYQGENGVAIVRKKVKCLDLKMMDAQGNRFTIDASCKQGEVVQLPPGRVILPIRFGPILLGSKTAVFGRGERIAQRKTEREQGSLVELRDRTQAAHQGKFHKMNPNGGGRHGDKPGSSMNRFHRQKRDPPSRKCSPEKREQGSPKQKRSGGQQEREGAYCPLWPCKRGTWIGCSRCKGSKHHEAVCSQKEPRGHIMHDSE
ncbi:hypothetical protein L596_019167 [Steinernema carpocapsae]|uniref:Uncharacterized protein n=1 Tax=Steinernema carpocapsae TaxID=34508 RepID=A0A4U5N839_STECR|nr:hypothetical protein L596_019167 [Steinernema carpocapsae]